MAGMQSFNPIKIRDFGKANDLRGISTLAALQGKQLNSATEKGREIGQYSRGSEIEEKIKQMDLQTATPAQVAKLRGEGSLTPQMLDRLKMLSGDAENIQTNNNKVDAATTLFGRQQNLQGQRDAASMARKQLGIDATNETNTESMAGLGDINQELQTFHTIANAPITAPEGSDEYHQQIQQREEAKAGILESETRAAQMTANMKGLPADSKVALLNKSTTTGLEGTNTTKRPLNRLTGKENKRTEIQTKSIKSAMDTVSDPLVRQEIMLAIEAGQNITPRYESYTKEDGTKVRNVVGFNRNGQPLDIGNLRKILRNK